MCLDTAQAQPLTLSNCQTRQKLFDHQMIVNVLWKNIQLASQRVHLKNINLLLLLLPFFVQLHTEILCIHNIFKDFNVYFPIFEFLLLVAIITTA